MALLALETGMLVVALGFNRIRIGRAFGYGSPEERRATRVYHRAKAREERREQSIF